MTEKTNVADEIEKLVDRWHTRLVATPANLAHSKPSVDRWSISEVIGHLVDSACNNHQRFVLAQSNDPLTLASYEQNKWVSVACYRQLDWSSLVTLWCEYNRMLSVLIRNIPDDCLDVACTITPYDTCTLGFLVRDYLDHLNHHLTILDSRLQNEDR